VLSVPSRDHEAISASFDIGHGTGSRHLLDGNYERRNLREREAAPARDYQNRLFPLTY